MGQPPNRGWLSNLENDGWLRSLDVTTPTAATSSTATETGTFFNRDPIGYGGGINLYEYVGDDPTRHTDASGKYTIELPKPGEDLGPNHCECQNGMMVPASSCEDTCACLHEWVHALFDYPPDVCKNKPNGAVAVYDPNDPMDQIELGLDELRATSVEMACRSILSLIDRCKGDRNNADLQQFMVLEVLPGYMWNNVLRIKEAIEELMNEIGKSYCALPCK